MKTTMRGLIFVVLAVTGCMSLLASNARGVEDAMPPEVRVLIGMRIQSERHGEFGRIKNWKSKGWTTLNIFPKPNQTIGVQELYRNDMSIFVIELMDKTDWSMTLLDVRVLPRHMLEYDVKNGEIVWKKSSHAYRFEPMCYRKLEERIVALMRPEQGKGDCTHTTRQVKRAWKVDEQTLRISEIAPQGVSCAFMDSEYSCDR